MHSTQYPPYLHEGHRVQLAIVFVTTMNASDTLMLTYRPQLRHR